MMQSAKLDHLHCKAYFNSTLFAFKKRKIRCSKFIHLHQCRLFVHKGKISFLFYLFYHLTCLIKKNNLLQGTIRKTLQSTKSNYNNCILVVYKKSKILCDKHSLFQK